MSGESPITTIQRLCLLAVLAGLAACGRGDSDPGTQASAAGRGDSDPGTRASAAPDPFVGDYYDGSDPMLRITRSGERYEAFMLDLVPPSGPVLEVECDDETRQLLDQARQYDPVAICFPEGPDNPHFTLVHTRATPTAPLLDTNTGYAAIMGGFPWEFRREAPAGEPDLGVRAAERAVATQAGTITGNFGGPDCFWDRIELRSDGTALLLHSQYRPEEGRHYQDGQFVVIDADDDYHMMPQEDGSLRGVQWILGTCIPVR
jgi:hypothetical protein